MNLRAEDWVYAIREWRATSENTTTDLNNFDPTSIVPTCAERKSTDGQQYRLCHWLDYGKISVYEVKFIKKGVFIDTTFPTTIQKPIVLDELNGYVDSFSPANLDGIPILEDAV
jgi:hypothetical protein